MTQEAYCSTGIVKMLLEKGCPLDKVRVANRLPIYYTKRMDEEGWNDCDAYYIPTQAQVLKWLREVHEIFIRPNISFLYPIRYYCEIFCYGDNLKTQQDVTTENFESPEEACEAAIKHCLETLI